MATNQDPHSILIDGMGHLVDKVLAMMVPLVIALFIALAIRIGIKLWMKNAGFSRRTADAVSYACYAIVGLVVIIGWSKYMLVVAAKP